MRKLVRIIGSMSRPAFWLFVMAMASLAVLLILAAFQLVKIHPQKWWPF
jgi:hypothetical protein